MQIEPIQLHRTTAKNNRSYTLDKDIKPGDDKSLATFAGKPYSMRVFTDLSQCDLQVVRPVPTHTSAVWHQAVTALDEFLACNDYAYVRTGRASGTQTD